MLESLYAIVASVTGAKCIGSCVGSSMAVVVKHDSNSPLWWIKKFIVGMIVGFISAPIVIDFMGWEHTWDFWLSSATISGMSGYVLAELIIFGGWIDKLGGKK